MRRKSRKQQTSDVRPLDQRYKAGDPKEIRKGMIKQSETVNINWMEKQQNLLMQGL